MARPPAPAPTDLVFYSGGTPFSQQRRVVNIRNAKRRRALTATIADDTSGGHLSVAEVRVRDRGGRLIARGDGRAPLQAQAGRDVEVVVEYVEREKADPGAYEARMVLRDGASTVMSSAIRVVPAREILIVADGGPAGIMHTTFAPGIPPPDDGNGVQYFNLAHLLRTFATQLPGYRIRRVHRHVDESDFSRMSADDRALFQPHAERYRFDTDDLSRYDQIWLFGVGTPNGTPPITDDELIALARFQDGGGGLFATGDHEDLGQPLCGRVLRVRSMRKWWFKQQGPDNEPRAPDALSPLRVDTTQPGPGDTLTSPDFRFDNQSDDVPQPITATAAGARHALLALPKGRRLSVLPDHMHEGEVIDPFDGTYRFSPTVRYRRGGSGAPAVAPPSTDDAGELVEFVEYPNDAKGGQPRPEVLAVGSVLAGHSTRSTEKYHVGAEQPTAGPRQTGVLGAYDGHAAGVGRVVVSSTFHHFVDINLTGDLRAINADGTPDPLRRQGFLASQVGRAHLTDIEAFFCNIARWLSRPTR